MLLLLLMLMLMLMPQSWFVTGQTLWGDIMLLAACWTQGDGRVAWSYVGPLVAPFLAKAASGRLNLTRSRSGMAARVAADVRSICCGS